MNPIEYLENKRHDRRHAGSGIDTRGLPVTTTNASRIRT